METKNHQEIRVRRNYSSCNSPHSDNMQFMTSDSNLHSIMMKFGHFLGCHQLPERSFFIGGRQFPLCARCTGLVVGYIVYFVFRNFFAFSFLWSALFCEIMFLDWLIQRLEIRQSTNLRRFVTGSLCGYGLMSIYIWALTWLIERLQNI